MDKREMWGGKGIEKKWNGVFGKKEEKSGRKGDNLGAIGKDVMTVSNSQLEAHLVGIKGRTLLQNTTTNWIAVRNSHKANLGGCTRGSCKTACTERSLVTRTAVSKHFWVVTHYWWLQLSVLSLNWEKILRGIINERNNFLSNCGLNIACVKPSSSTSMLQTKRIHKNTQFIFKYIFSNHW